MNETTSWSEVSASEGLEAVVSDLIASGRYETKDEVLREGVRLVEEREKERAALDAALLRGLADAEAKRVRPVADVFQTLKTRYAIDPADDVH